MLLMPIPKFTAAGADEANDRVVREASDIASVHGNESVSRLQTSGICRAAGHNAT